jgi:hypothetical protein
VVGLRLLRQQAYSRRRQTLTACTAVLSAGSATLWAKSALEPA